MVIADDRPTDKPTYRQRFGEDFDRVRGDSLAWLTGQELALFAFRAGQPGMGVDAVALLPANAGFFALGLALLQGVLPPDDLPEGFQPKCAIYVVPPFRHTHFGGKQMVVHNRLHGLHEPRRDSCAQRRTDREIKPG